jgi:xanthine/uracil permease
VPELLLVTLATSLLLALSGSPRAPLYAVLFGAQMGLVLAALLGWLSLRYRVRLPLVHIPFYFVLANVAAFWGFLLYLKGERKVTWTTVR